MSFRSGSNTDFTFNNLTVNGKLTLTNELDITDLDVEGDADVENLNVRGDANVVGGLVVKGDTNLNTLEVVDLNVTGDSVLTELNVTGNAIVVGNTSLNTLSVSGVCDLNEKVNVDTLVVLNDFDVLCGINVNNAIVSPEELSYVHGVTSSIQGQLNDKANTSNPTFTGSAIMPTTYSKGFTYFGNDGSLPTFNISQYFGAIGTNIAGGGNGEMDFINTGYMASDMALSAFDRRPPKLYLCDYIIVVNYGLQDYLMRLVALKLLL